MFDRAPTFHGGTSSKYPRHTHADSIPYSTVGNLCHEVTELTWHHNITLYVVYVCSNVVMSLRYGTQHMQLLSHLVGIPVERMLGKRGFAETDDRINFPRVVDLLVIGFADS